MFSPLALILIPIGYLYLIPIVDKLLKKREGDPPSPLEIISVSILASLGLLTVFMFWIGQLPSGALSPVSVLIFISVWITIGIWVNREWYITAALKKYLRYQWQVLARFDIESLLMWAILGVLFVMLINSLYYPFIGDDAISRYGLQAQLIYRAQSFPSDIYGYPPLAALTFVATWFAAGTTNEQLARLFPFVMSVGTLMSTYLVGKQVHSRRAGLFAATLVAFSPAFIRYGTLAYVDIPSTFPVTLAAYYLLRWWDTQKLPDAILAGASIGVALLIKQSAFTWLAGLGVAPIIYLIAVRHDDEKVYLRQVLTSWIGFLLVPLLIAGFWYARNILTGGILLPVAGLYHLLGEGTGLIGIIPSLGWPGDFGPLLRVFYALGWVIGMVMAFREGIAVLRGNLKSRPAQLLIASLIIPYWIAWWLKFSFDGRFLVMIMPLMAIWSIPPLLTIIDWLSSKVTLPRLVWQIMMSIILAGLLFWGAKDRLGAVYYMLTRPFDSNIERLSRAKSSMFLLTEYVKENLDPEEDRILLIDGRMSYYLLDFDTDSFYPLTIADLEGFDYVVYSSSMASIYNDRLGWHTSEFFTFHRNELIFETLYEIESIRVVKILRYDLPSSEERRDYREQRKQEQENLNANEETP